MGLLLAVRPTAAAPHSDTKAPGHAVPGVTKCAASLSCRCPARCPYSACRTTAAGVLAAERAGSAATALAMNTAVTATTAMAATGMVTPVPTPTLLAAADQSAAP